ncbi:MAG: rRNA pseudouridine synthase [Verrucomicrobiaceae bacterium]|nr:rRNA pseudouridine synthase [Verrucomicrobiaceae bacterium]
MRLNRYLSLCGISSRRGSEQVILDGRVTINGEVCRELATQVETDDRVSVDGKPVRTALGVVIALHKPKGYLCTRGDTHDRATIYDLLPSRFQTLHHVGRLDQDSEGLILLTNRGELSQRLSHPSQGVEKEYEVTLDQEPDSAALAKLTRGVLTAEGFAKAERAWQAGPRKVHVILKQGLKRQIRLMFYRLGYEVERLIRIRIGWLQLKGMSRGDWRELTEAEIQRFLAEGKRQRADDAPPPAPKTQRQTATRSGKPAGRKSTGDTPHSSPSSWKGTGRPAHSTRRARTWK